MSIIPYFFAGLRWWGKAAWRVLYLAGFGAMCLSCPSLPAYKYHWLFLHRYPSRERHLLIPILLICPLFSLSSQTQGTWCLEMCALSWFILVRPPRVAYLALTTARICQRPLICCLGFSLSYSSRPHLALVSTFLLCNTFADPGLDDDMA